MGYLDCAKVSFSPSCASQLLTELLPGVFQSNRRAVGRSFSLLCGFILGLCHSVLQCRNVMVKEQRSQDSPDRTKLFSGSNTH